jgi:hypothetical protein
MSREARYATATRYPGARWARSAQDAEREGGEVRVEDRCERRSWPALGPGSRRHHRQAMTSALAAVQATGHEILLRHLTGPAAAEGLTAFAERRQLIFGAAGTRTGAGAP